MSSNTHPHPHEFDPNLAPRRRRKPHGWSKSGIVKTFGSLAVATALLTTTDVPGRIVRSAQNRPQILRESIEHFSNKNFVLDRTQANSDYYLKKGITDSFDIDRLAHSLTRLDILVALFHSGKLTETDFLHYVVGSNERIVTEQGVSLERILSHEGKATHVEGAMPLEDLTTAFITNLVQDSNNPEKKKHNLQIAPRAQGGGYVLSFEHEGKKYTIELAFRLSR